MDEQTPLKEIDRGLVALIVRSYVAHNNLSVDQIAGLISEVHRSLAGLGKDASVHEALVPAVPIKRSVQRDFVVCLECGYRCKLLRRHLRSQHGLDAADYRARWNLSPDHPLTAPGYSERRSVLAKQIGLGHHRSGAAAPEIPKTSEPAATAPKRRGRKPRALVAE